VTDKRKWAGAAGKGADRGGVGPVRSEVQADGRIRYRGYVEEFGERALRVLTLADGGTVHNAFPDRGFEEEPT
jgi:hypothetical protein